MVLLRDDRLFLSNCGDLRAVLAMRGMTTRKEMEIAKMTTEDDEQRRTDENNNGGGSGGGDLHNRNINRGNCRDRNISRLNEKLLLMDQNLDSLGERECIFSLGGYATPHQELGLLSQVWLDHGPHPDQACHVPLHW
jgi:hypothetical protein